MSSVKPDLRVVRTMPAQKPGKSKQDYETPRDFLAAVEKRFGAIDLDLAATNENAKGKFWITEEENSLAADWDRYHRNGCGLAFLNPPFGGIGAWARKCAEAETLPILFLVPASVGTNWWAESVHGVAALVLFLRGRIEFDGLPCTRRKGKVQTCQHDASAHRMGGACGGSCKLCDCSGFCKDGYVKDCALVVYRHAHVTTTGLGFLGTRYDCWDWRAP